MPETSEEKKVRSIVSNAEQKVHDLDHEGMGQGPAPQPAPPGGGAFIGNNHGQRIVAEAEKAHLKEAIRQEALDKTAEVIKGAPVDTQAKAYKIADDFTYPATAAPYDPKKAKGQEKDLDETQRSVMHQLGKKERDAEKASPKSIDEAQRSAMEQMGHTARKERHEKEKDISESQDYAMRSLGDEKEKNSMPPEKEAEPFKGASMSKSFTASLGYNKLNKSLEKTPDNKETKQPMVMSGKFSASLGYNNISKESPASGPTRDTKSKEPDLDR